MKGAQRPRSSARQRRGATLTIQSNRTADHQEAVNAFRDKRAPKFTG